MERPNYCLVLVTWESGEGGILHSVGWAIGVDGTDEIVLAAGLEPGYNEDWIPADVRHIPRSNVLSWCVIKDRMPTRIRTHS